ncbi:MAG: RsmB/NOP family class I SAM-dependent RNA methyltransferase [Verrucomicrobia bacterium]|nr:RsmB/NOP family class I SAM-dependent RNA methyltransferase [Verrucomicrobiota bacterium]
MNSRPASPPRRRSGERRPRPIDSWQAAALEVIGRADRRNPADAVLRDVLHERARRDPALARTVVARVTDYYRWLGCLDRGWTRLEQLDEAAALQERFQRNPAAFPGDLLARIVPGWLEDALEVGRPWLESLQQPPTVWLRARPGHGAELAQRLGSCRPAGPGPLQDALAYHGSSDLFHTPEFQAGEFEVQDLSSQVVGLICQPEPGAAWWDVCAGEGGKTLHLADLMQNRGLVWATDRAGWRLDRLRRRAARARIFNCRLRVWRSPPERALRTRFAGVLVDAPCSGVGTWQRNPQARWTTVPADVDELARQQGHLLATAAAALRPGGRIVYAVCTLTRSETTGVADRFERAHPSFAPWPIPDPAGGGRPPGARLWLGPPATPGNGMFVAAWQRIE